MYLVFKFICPKNTFDLQKAELEAEKEREEAIENFKKLDSNQDGVVDIAEIQSRETFDRDRNGEGA